MTTIEAVDAAVRDVPYMTLDLAKTLQEFWNTAPPGDILELGFAHGKGSAYLGALASERGHRVTCVDNGTARTREPSAFDTVAAAGVAEHVDLVVAEDGYLWWMKQQLEAGDCQRYSLVYIDGAHSWFVDGFAALMIDRFIIPGGILIFDDLDWSYSWSVDPEVLEMRKTMSPDVVEEKQIRKVWELLIQPNPIWGQFEERDAWAIARKVGATETRGPVERVVIKPSASAIVASAFTNVKHRLEKIKP